MTEQLRVLHWDLPSSGDPFAFDPLDILLDEVKFVRQCDAKIEAWVLGRKALQQLADQCLPEIASAQDVKMLLGQVPSEYAATGFTLLGFPVLMAVDNP